jgi:sugar-specific transcriptional regulator TrmB
MSIETIEKLINDFRADFHSSLDKIEKKIDETIHELKDVNARAITNTTNISNVKEDIVEKSTEFHRQINILHKRLKDCNSAHERCPEKTKADSILEMKVWFYGTWVVGAFGFLAVLLKDTLFK